MCELDPQKVCDNCGKCMEGYDYTGIQIDDLIMDSNDKEYESDYADDSWKFSKESWDDCEEDDTLFIDDVEGLAEEIEAHRRSHDEN